MVSSTSTARRRELRSALPSEETSPPAGDVRVVETRGSRCVDFSFGAEVSRAELLALARPDCFAWFEVCHRFLNLIPAISLPTVLPLVFVHAQLV